MVAPHPDDEVLGFGGVIERARLDGRQVTVAVVTNGERDNQADYGRRRDRESNRAISFLLNVPSAWQSGQLALLGYPGNKQLPNMMNQATCPPAYVSATSGKSSTWAEDFGAPGTDVGDYHRLRFGSAACYSRTSLVGDLVDLLARSNATDVYTTAEWDNHPDHQATFQAVRAALIQTGRPVALHVTIIHSPHTNNTQDEAKDWPNPRLASTDASTDCNVLNCDQRFTPADSFRPYPVNDPDTEWSNLAPAWATSGRRWAYPRYVTAPDQFDPVSVPVPASMTATDLIVNPSYNGSTANEDPATCAKYSSSNRKWQAITRYCSQLWPRVNEFGYMLAFVKKNEFFWDISPRPAVASDDGATQTSTTQLRAAWSEPAGQGPSATGFRVGIGSAPGLTDVVAYQDAGNAASRTFTGLALTPGGTYYATVDPYIDLPTGGRLFGPVASADGIVTGSAGGGGGGGGGNNTGTLAKVTVKVSATLITRHGRRFVRVSGRTDRRLAGKRVLVQRRAGKKVVVIGRPKVGKLGRFAATLKVPARGPVKVRASAPRTATTAAAVSRFITVRPPRR